MKSISRGQTVNVITGKIEIIEIEVDVPSEVSET